MSKENSKTIIPCAPELTGRTDTNRIRALTGVSEDGRLPEEFFHVQIAGMTPESVTETARAAANFLRECQMAPPLVVRDDLSVSLVYKIAEPPEDFLQVKARAGQVIEMMFTDGRRGTQATIGGPLELEGRIYDNTVAESEITALDKVGWYFPEQVERPHEVCNYDTKSFSIKHFLRVQGLKADLEQHGDITAYRLYRDPLAGEPTQTASFYERLTPDGPCIVYHDTAPGKTGIRWDAIRKHLAPDPEELAAKGLQRRMRPTIHQEQEDESTPIWPDLAEIPDEDEENIPTLSTGIPALDTALEGGIQAGQLTIITGIPSSGKSVFISQLILNAAEQGTKCGVFSGELPPKRFKSWFMQQAAGPHCIKLPTGRWMTPPEIKDQIGEWLKGRVYLYDNRRGLVAEKIIRTAETEVTTKGLGLLVFDNFMMMGLGDVDKSGVNPAQTDVALALAELAKKYEICIILVAHPKKLTGFLTPYDVSGTSNLYNLCDNLFAVHRHKAEVIAGMKKMYGFPDNDPIYIADNSIQVMKNRGGGPQDIFVPLIFNAQARTLTDMADPRPVTRAWEMMAQLRGEES